MCIETRQHKRRAVEKILCWKTTHSGDSNCALLYLLGQCIVYLPGVIVLVPFTIVGMFAVGCVVAGVGGSCNNISTNTLDTQSVLTHICTENKTGLRWTPPPPAQEEVVRWPSDAELK